ncbi:unnamed protein product [Brassica oleracea]|uniref:Uncharacterized protein n=1 Tax=Brassica oleracea TaxID=3712 RepID=A0A3P6GWG5_BRAOL|nr:unnamed protein product [Brassica oleracea]
MYDDILLLYMSKDHIRGGEIVVFNVTPSTNLFLSLRSVIVPSYIVSKVTITMEMIDFYMLKDSSGKYIGDFYLTSSVCSANLS